MLDSTALPFSSLLFLRLQEEQLSPEEQLAEKLRVQKLQEESDLELTKDAFGEARVVETRCEPSEASEVIGVWAFQAWWAAPPTAWRASTPCVPPPKKSSTSSSGC